MKAYLDLLQFILENGEEKDDRTNTGTISSFGHQLDFDLEFGFPAVTTKSLAWKGVVSELLWFLEGSDDERRLAEIRFSKDRSELTNLEKYSTIWTDNADKQGKELGYENNDLQKLLGPVFAYNFVVIVQIALCGYGAWLLAFKKTGDAFASYAALFIFEMTPHIMGQAYNGISETVCAGWFPLSIWSLFCLMERPNWKTT